MREKLIKEKNSGGMARNFGHDKTTSIVSEHYFWPHLSQYVKNFVHNCRVCQTTKGVSQNTRLYQLFPIPSRPWGDIHMDFILGFPRTQRGNDSIFILGNRFSKMDHFIPYHNTHDAIHIVYLFF